MMGEEQQKKDIEVDMEIIILGTGLFDRILTCGNYLDFTFKNYYQKNKNDPVNPNISFKTEIDR